MGRNAQNCNITQQAGVFLFYDTPFSMRPQIENHMSFSALGREFSAEAAYTRAHLFFPVKKVTSSLGSKAPKYLEYTQLLGSTNFYVIDHHPLLC